MDLDVMKKWLDLVSGFAALLAGLATALWAYSKYIVERGLLPPAQFDVDCKFLGVQDTRKVMEVLIHLKNLGTSTLIVSNLRLEILYLDAEDQPCLFDNPAAPAFGRLQFPRSLQRDLHQVRQEGAPRGIKVIPHDTFVQPGVDQIYPLTTTIPGSTSHVLIWSSFEYAQYPTAISRFLLSISRQLGLIQYSLDHVRKPHTTERVFQVLEPG